MTTPPPSIGGKSCAVVVPPDAADCRQRNVPRPAPAPSVGNAPAWFSTVSSTCITPLFAPSAFAENCALGDVCVDGNQWSCIRSATAIFVAIESMVVLLVGLKIFLDRSILWKEQAFHCGVPMPTSFLHRVQVIGAKNEMKAAVDVD